MAKKKASGKPKKDQEKEQKKAERREEKRQREQAEKQAAAAEAMYKPLEDGTYRPSKDDVRESDTDNKLLFPTLKMEEQVNLKTVTVGDDNATAYDVRDSALEPATSSSANGYAVRPGFGASDREVYTNHFKIQLVES